MKAGGGEPVKATGRKDTFRKVFVLCNVLVLRKVLVFFCNVLVSISVFSDVGISGFYCMSCEGAHRRPELPMEAAGRKAKSAIICFVLLSKRLLLFRVK